jgi:hypothetical protein
MQDAVSKVNYAMILNISHDSSNYIYMIFNNFQNSVFSSLSITLMSGDT